MASGDLDLRVQLNGNEGTLASAALYGASLSANPPSEDPLPRRRLLAFLLLHFLGLIGHILVLILFFFTRDWWFFAFVLLPFLFTGLFCTYVSWNHKPAINGCGTVLPLRMQRWPLNGLWAVPYGWGQWIIVALALEEYRLRQLPRAGEPSTSVLEYGGASMQEPEERTMNKFSCKAITSIFEGFLNSAVCLYAFWGLHYPKRHPITHGCYSLEHHMLIIVVIISFLTSGLGLLELDFCVSSRIRARMQRSMMYEICHGLFRSSEVVFRTSLFMAFMILSRRQHAWWYFPLFADFVVTLFLVVLYSGAETTFLVQVLCGLPCAFANIFLFIDSPYKRRVARKLSVWLTIRTVAETLLLVVLLLSEVSQIFRNEEDMYDLRHPDVDLLISYGVSSASVMLYFTLLWWVTAPGVQRDNEIDIFSACEAGDLAVVRSMTRQPVGLDVNCFDVDGKSPLMVAALRGHVEVCAVLCSEGARVDLSVFRQGSALFKLLSKHARFRWTALHMVADQGNCEVTEVLLDAADAAIHRARVAAAAHAASKDAAGCGTRSSQIPREDFRDVVGDTPLHVAARRGHVDVVEVIARARPTWIRMVNNAGHCPADVARSSEVRQAIRHAASVRSRTLARDRLVVPLDAGAEVRSPNRESEMPAELWTTMRLQICRSMVNNRVAPGLCSYIVCSGGGSLGRALLIDRNQSDLQHSPIAEMQPAASQASTQIQTSEGRNDQPSSSWVGALAGNLPEIKNLEPCDRRGQPIAWWSQAMRGMPNAFLVLPVEARLGEGAYGQVWRARDRAGLKTYAVKNIIVNRCGQSKLRSAAINECEMCDHVRMWPHPCIVQLIHVHFFEDASLYVMVMEYCPRGDLLGRIVAARREAEDIGVDYMAPSQAAFWMAQIFLGIEHLHLRADALIRDLKPANVVRTEAGLMKITDFGFGRFGADSAGKWTFGCPPGTPGYVAPEVLRQERYDFSADLYSFGVLCWVTFSGGVTYHRDPRPPTGRLTRGADYKAHYDDWRLLKVCIEEPFPNGAVPILAEPRALITQLTQRSSSSRPTHMYVRQFPFIKNTGLPSLDDGRHAVEQWLNEKLRDSANVSEESGSESRSDDNCGAGIGAVARPADSQERAEALSS